MNTKTMRLRRKAAPVLPEGTQAAIDDAVTTQVAAAIQGLVDNHDRALFDIGKGIVDLHFASCMEQAGSWFRYNQLAEFDKSVGVLHRMVLEIAARINTPDLASRLEDYYEDQKKHHNQYMAGIENHLLDEQKREEEEVGWSSRLDEGVREIPNHLRRFP